MKELPIGWTLLFAGNRYSPDACIRLSAHLGRAALSNPSVKITDFRRNNEKSLTTHGNPGTVEYVDRCGFARMPNHSRIETEELK